MRFFLSGSVMTPGPEFISDEDPPSLPEGTRAGCAAEGSRRPNRVLAMRIPSLQFKFSCEFIF